MSDNLESDSEDLSQRIASLLSATRSTPCSDLPAHLDTLAHTLAKRFSRCGDISDLSNALAYGLLGVALAPQSDRALPHYVASVGRFYVLRFERNDNIRDISEGIKYLQLAIQLVPEHYTLLGSYLGNLGGAFLQRFQRRGYINDLAEAVDHLQHAVRIASVDSPENLDSLTNLGNALRLRFQSSGEIRDLSGGISHHQRVVQLTAEDHPNFPARLASLATSLYLRFKRNNDIHDLSEATNQYQRAIQLTPVDHPRMRMLLNNLGTLIRDRFHRNGDVRGLSEAIVYQRRALQLTPEGDPWLRSYVGNLGLSLGIRFHTNGDTHDLSEAINHHRRAAQLTPEDHPDFPVHLCNLGTILTLCFNETGNVHDLSEAIRHHRRAIQLTPDDHPDFPMYLNRLGSSFQSRFHKSANVDDLTEAVSQYQRAIRLTPEEHPDLWIYLCNLGSSFHGHFDTTGDIRDLSEAIKHLRRSVRFAPDGHPDLPMVLNNLGSLVLSGFQRCGDVHNLPEAINYLQQAVELTPEGHALLATYLVNLGGLFKTRFDMNGDLVDKASAIAMFRRASTSPTAGPTIRLRAANQWASMYPSKPPSSPTSEFLEPFQHIIGLLPVIAGMEITLEQRHGILSQCSKLSTMAAAAAFSIGQPATALEWLEQGRCIVWNQIDTLRSPLGCLHAEHPTIAKRLLTLSAELHGLSARIDPRRVGEDLPLGVVNSLQDQAHRHLCLARERDQLLSAIHNIPGFEKFLQPRTCAAIMDKLPLDGPVVVINIEAKRCDAVILKHGDATPLHLPLPDFTHEIALLLTQKLERHRNQGAVRTDSLHPDRGSRLTSANGRDELEEVLLVLWIRLVKPILDGASITSVHGGERLKLPRIWWCPTGPLSFLPIHAAGDFIQGKGRPGRRLSDFVVSSYTPALASLVARLEPREITGSVFAGPLLVSEPDAPGLPIIPSTTTEIAQTRWRLDDQEVPVCVLEKEEAIIEDVLELMDLFSSIHLACHASQNFRNPLESAFHLHDGSLALSTIIKKDLRFADFAFLSACETGMGTATVPEEAAHLAAGMLAAGYRSVVATMWSILDRYGPAMSRLFYENLLAASPEGTLDGACAARALHYATQRFQEEYEGSHAWIAYIHVGI